MDFTESFTEALLAKEEEIKNTIIKNFMIHVKSHDFVEAVKMEGGSLNITLKERVVESNSIVVKAFINGGVLRKKSSSGKDKVDENDFFYVKAF